MYGIFTHIWDEFMVNVGVYIYIYIYYMYIYVPYMDPMGSDTFESQLTVKQPPKAFI